MPGITGIRFKRWVSRIERSNRVNFTLFCTSAECEVAMACRLTNIALQMVGVPD
jgi:hypothetical protein